MGDTAQAYSLNEKKIQTSKLLLWISMGSMLMLFAGLTSAYVVRKMEGNWAHFELPFSFFLSTAIIIISSITINIALNKARLNNQSHLKQFLLFTLLLGLVFFVAQFIGWDNLTQQGVYLTGGNPSGSFLFVLTGVHALHLIGGLIALLIVNIKAYLGKYHSQNTLGIELCASYWHFLDILWVYLFLFLFFIR